MPRYRIPPTPDSTGVSAQTWATAISLASAGPLPDALRARRYRPRKPVSGPSASPELKDMR